MRLTPLLYAADIDRPAEVVSVLGIIEPTFLACRFGGLAALRFETVFLPPPIPTVGGEEVPAARAFALSGLFCH